MAEIKKRIMSFSSGKQVKLFGNSLAINKSLEISEGYAPNIFSLAMSQSQEKAMPLVLNPYKLSQEEMLELADYNIRLWMDLKDSVRQHGIGNAKLFNKQEIL